MFTKLVVSFFDTATNLVNTKVPHFALDPQVFSNASNAVSVISDFLRDVNFIIPLKDIAIIIGIDVGIRVFKMALFWSNWLIDKVLEVL